MSEDTQATPPPGADSNAAEFADAQPHRQLRPQPASTNDSSLSVTTPPPVESAPAPAPIPPTANPSAPPAAGQAQMGHNTTVGSPVAEAAPPPSSANGGSPNPGSAATVSISSAPVGSPQAPVSQDTAGQTIKTAISLGAVLMELKGRIMEADLLGPDKVVPPGQLAVGFQVASNWRGLYNRAITLHQTLLGDSEVDLARYNMAPDKPLYLIDQIAFVNIGLAESGLRFQLAEKLRRVLNFLTSLYQKLDGYDQILTQIFTSEPPYLSLPDPTLDNPAPTTYNFMIHTLSLQVEALITAWDSYVRERLQAESRTLLVARYGYEAGRLLSDQSWSLVVRTTPYRQDMLKGQFDGKEAEMNQDIYSVWIDLFKPRRIVEMQRQIAGLVGALEEDYLARHPRLAAKLTSDDPEAGQDEIKVEEIDLQSPRAIINAVVQSIDYWQRTILEMSEKGILQRSNSAVAAANIPVAGPPTWNEPLKLHPSWNYDQLMDLRSAFVEQSNNWFSLISGRQDLSSFRVVNIASDLIQDYSQDITRLASRNLQEAFKQVLQELNLLATTGINATKAVAEAGLAAVGSFFRNRWLWIGLGGGVALIALVLLLVAVVIGMGGDSLVVAILTPAVGALVPGLGISRFMSESKAQIANAQKAGEDNIQDKNQQSQQRVNDSANIGALTLTAAGALRDYLEKAFSRGFKQLQVELGLISATLAVTGPLIEFVIRHCDPNNELEFMGKVVWNDTARKNQLNRIVIAAFGPVGAFLIASSDNGELVPSSPPGTTTATSPATRQ